MKVISSLIFVLTLVLLSVTPATAGLFDKITNTSGGSDIDTLLGYVTTADTTFKKSVNIVFSILATEEEKVKIETKQKAANATKDPKEKEAKIKEILIQKEAAIKKATANKDCASKCATLDSKKKELYSQSVYNMLLAGIYDYYAAEQGSAITQKCSANPTSCASYSFKLNKISGIVGSLPSQAKSMSDLGSTLLKIGKASKIEIEQPKSIKDKPKEVNV